MKLTFEELMREYVNGEINMDTMLKVTYTEAGHANISKVPLRRYLSEHVVKETSLHEIVKQKKKMYVHEYCLESPIDNESYCCAIKKVISRHKWDDFKKAWTNLYLLETKEIEAECD